jgi:hypothetical protein
LNKEQELVLSQLKAAVRTSGKLIEDFWGKDAPESRLGVA